MDTTQTLDTFYNEITATDITEEKYLGIVSNYKDFLINEFARTRMAYEAKQRSSGNYMDGLLVANVIIPTSANIARLERSVNTMTKISQEAEEISSVCESLKSGEPISKDVLLRAVAIVRKPTSVKF